MTEPPADPPPDPPANPPGPPPARSASDIRRDDWIERHVSPRIRPFFRLARVDRPIGVWLLVIPCWWGSLLAGASITGAYISTAVFAAPLFLIGAFVMRSAGCVWNDINDRKIDAKVARTAARPIASGQITVGEGLLFMAILLAVGLLVLLQFNTFTVCLAIAALPLVALYPLMKRITHWPQAWLGLTYNWGVLVGYASITQDVRPAALALYAGGVFWTLGYDTIYAHQDKEDDALVGIGSTALKFGERTWSWLAMFYTAAIGCFALAGTFSDMAWPYYAFLALPALHFANQIRILNIHDPQSCLQVFKSNRNAGLLLLVAIVMGRPIP